MSDGKPQQKRYGVLIASSEFPDEPKLQDLACPENDVDGLYEVLNDESIGGFTELVVIKNQPHYVVLRDVHKVLRKADRDDLVLIFYAGHGKLDRAGRLHLATTDTITEELESTSIPATRIRDLIENADTSKSALILDCCYSGAIEKSFLRGDVDEQLNLMAGGHGTFIMTASTDVQTAREEISDGYGLFTKHVLAGLKGGAADADGDGIITMNELYNYVHRQVAAESHQVPMKWDLNVQGELVVAQTGRKPREERRLAIREKLFALADQGLIPDLVLTKALEVSNLPYEKTQYGVAAKYDALLDRILQDDMRVGRFVNDWLQVPPESTPEPKPQPTPQPQPQPQPQPVTPAKPVVLRTADENSLFWKLIVAPYPCTQENLDRNPLYRLLNGPAIKARKQAISSNPNSENTAEPLSNNTATGGGGTAPNTVVTKTDYVILVAWFVIGLPIMVVVAALSLDSTGYADGGNPGGNVGILWAIVGIMIVVRARARFTPVIKRIYWVGIAVYLLLSLAIISES